MKRIKNKKEFRKTATIYPSRVLMKAKHIVDKFQTEKNDK